jgi:hypothetical protein
VPAAAGSGGEGTPGDGAGGASPRLRIAGVFAPAEGGFEGTAAALGEALERALDALARAGGS